MLDFYRRENQRYLEKCTQCGLCARGCPILSLTDLTNISPQEIQRGVFAFMDGGKPNALAYTKAFACMACFKCTAGMCPENLNPMIINEFIKGAYIGKGLETLAIADTDNPAGTHRVLARIQLSAIEYQRISTPSKRRKVGYVFFPGCNVYFQPEKILNALDILDTLGDDYAFLPGLDYCCGENHLFSGHLKEGCQEAENLVTAIAGFEPEAVLLWCPTCRCCFEKVIAPGMEIPFEVQSFSQYLAGKMSQLPLSRAAAGTVTLHEACKSAYIGVDRDGPRNVLRQLPGVELREMVHHGEKTICCGSGAASWFPDSATRIRNRRLYEAAQTGAEQLVTVCHYCNQTFAAEEARYDFQVTNYIDLVAQAMGIQRESLFKKYLQWRDIDRIMAHADRNIADAPFTRKQVAAVLQTVFLG